MYIIELILGIIVLVLCSKYIFALGSWQYVEYFGCNKYMIPFRKKDIKIYIIMTIACIFVGRSLAFIS